MDVEPLLVVAIWALAQSKTELNFQVKLAMNAFTASRSAAS